MSMHTIDQAKNMRNGINLEGEVVRKGETRTVSKKTGGTIDVCDAYLKDSANEEIKITLWAEDIEKISQGAKHLKIQTVVFITLLRDQNIKR